MWTTAQVLTALLFALGGSTTHAPPVSYGPSIEIPAHEAVNGLIAFQGNDNVRTVMPNGRKMQVVTHGPGRTGSGEFSPDGTRIAFTCNAGSYSMRPEQEICIVDRDGSNLMVLTEDNKADDAPSWSPDGRYLVFQKLVGKRFDYDTIEIFRMKTDGTEMVRLTNNDHSDASPDFSPDGARIIFGSESPYSDGIYSMAPDGSDRQVVVDGPKDEDSPRYSPDGGSIVYSVNQRVKTLDLSTMETQWWGRGSSPTWSPDQLWIVYSHYDYKREEPSLRKVMLLNGEEVIIAARNAYSPDWGPRVQR